MGNLALTWYIQVLENGEGTEGEAVLDHGPLRTMTVMDGDVCLIG
jgi:hypothetical protein